jgi:hypothetical protein
MIDEIHKKKRSIEVEEEIEKLTPFHRNARY